MSSSSNSGGGGGGAPAGGGGAPAGGGGGDDSPAACSGVGPVRVRVFRFFGRRSSTSQPSLSRPGQEGHDSDQDSTDSDENNKYAGSLSGSGMPCREARDRDSPCRGPNRRARSKKQSGSAASSVSSDCNGSSSSGDCFRSVSSNSQLTGSSSDSSSSNGDNSPGFGCGSACTPTVMGLEGGTSSDSGSGGSSGSEFGGTVRVFQTCLRPLTSLGAPAPSSSGYSSGSSSGSSSGRSNSCCCEACDSTLHKMFHTLSLSTLALTTLAPLGHRSSSCLSMGDAQHRQFHRNQHRHHHYLHHHTAYTLKETDAPSLPVPSPPTPVAKQDKPDKQDKDSKGHGKAPARILRSPVSYTYVRGISGLPTQRIPRHRLAPGPGSGAASKRPRSSPGHGHGHGLDGLSRHAYNS